MNNVWLEQCKYVPNGTGTLSKMPCRYPANYPKFLLFGDGGIVEDEKGNKYVDLISGLGAISVGYCNTRINAVVKEQLLCGTLMSLPSRKEYQLAKRLTELIPGTEMWKFGLNGTDANVMAVRAARAYTGRTKIITVGYNGCADVFECHGTRNAGIPKELKGYNTRLEYGVIPIESDEYACLLMEPMVFEYPRAGYLKSLRDWCNRRGTLLIFDEVVNVGRFKHFTSSSYFGIKPDLYTIGKGIANGLPLSAVGGTRRFMSVFERGDFFASGTFSSPLVSLAASFETLNILQEENEELIKKGDYIKKFFNNLPFPEKTEAVGYPTRLDFRFPTKEHKFLFWQEMCRNGVLVGYTNFVMTDYTWEDTVWTICRAMERACTVLQHCWVNPRSKLEGPLPEEALLRKN